ncbi:four helix bundle protein [Marinobacter sp. M1N3S26]|uniref:four helix bundle protein n=1 Tax=Marinobacter sp. M1N3S26 TaxID=3382299 RepID=UPI00387B2A5A
MTNARLPDIARKAERLLVDIETAVRTFTRYHKYTLGSDLRTQAMTVVRMCHRAWRDRARQAHWVAELIWAIDELKLSLQLGSQLRAFKNFRQFESLIRAAEEVGRCAGGWKRQMHHKSQNPTNQVSPERAQILSGRAASGTHKGAKP